MTTSEVARAKQVADAVQRSWAQTVPTVVYPLPLKKKVPPKKPNTNTPGKLKSWTEPSTMMYGFFYKLLFTFNV